MSPAERMHADARKADILRAVLPVFAIKGFAATTTKDLAKAAKVSEGLLYKHFPSKESMYQELGHVFSSKSTGVSRSLLDIPASTQALVTALYYLTRIILQGPCGGEKEHDYLHRMMCRSLLEDGLFAKTFMESAFLPYVEPMEAIFAAARKEGSLHTEARSDRFRIFFAHHLIVGVRLHGLRPTSHLEHVDQDAEMLRELALFNLRGAGLTDAAIRKHLDFKKLDRWYTDAFGMPSATAPKALKTRAGTASKKKTKK